MTWKTFCAAIFAALFIGPYCAAHAQDVTLTSRDGSIVLTGSLTSFDGEFYRIDTEYGVLTLDGQGVLCSGSGCPNLEDYVAEFTFSGARSMGEVLLPSLIEAYAQRRDLRVHRIIHAPERFEMALSDRETGRDVARIGFRLSTTEDGFADLVAGTADLAMVVREATEDEIISAKTVGFGDLSNPARVRILALDALVPIAAPDNPVRQISAQDLREILTGQKTRWDVFDAELNLHLTKGQSGVSPLVRNLMLGDTPLSSVAAFHAADGDVADAVAADPLGFGVARYSELGNARALTLEGACGMPLRATARSIRSEDYPFTTPLFLYTPPRRLPLVAREFLTFLRSREAQEMVRHAGFVNQLRQSTSAQRQGTRLMNAIANAGPEVKLRDLKRLSEVLRGTARLTTTFRFRDGSAGLDAQSFSNVQLLAEALEAGEFDDRTLIFVGFSDGSGAAQSNQRLAMKRAEAVRAAVQEAAFTADFGRVQLHADAFGEAMPMACETDFWGAAVNRRVEVWMR